MLVYVSQLKQHTLDSLFYYGSISAWFICIVCNAFMQTLFICWCSGLLQHSV